MELESLLEVPWTHELGTFGPTPVALGQRVSESHSGQGGQLNSMINAQRTMLRGYQGCPPVTKLSVEHSPGVPKPFFFFGDRPPESPVCNAVKEGKRQARNWNGTNDTYLDFDPCFLRRWSGSTGANKTR